MYKQVTVYATYGMRQNKNSNLSNGEYGEVGSINNFPVAISGAASSAIKGHRGKPYICIIMRMFHCTFKSNNCWRPNQFFSYKTLRSCIFTPIRSSRSLKRVADFNNKIHLISYIISWLAPGKTP